MSMTSYRKVVGTFFYLYKKNKLHQYLQVHDYLVHIKRDMGTHLIKHLWRMTLVFACLHNDQYTVANIQNLHVLTYHQQTRRLPFAKLVRQDVGLFSEEAGEVAFSLLSRSTLGDSVEDKHRRLNDCFQSIGAMREIKLDHFIDDEPANPKASRTTVAQTDDEVVALEQHFLVVLRALADGSFSYYSTPDALKRSNRFKGLWTSAPSAAVLLDPSSQLRRIWPKSERT